MNGNSNLMRAIRGPLVLITVGALFAFDHFTEFTLGRTWPALLIVLGVLSLAERFTAKATVPEYPQYPTQYTPPPPPPGSTMQGPQGGL
jgi:hypothetical protein